MIKKCERQLSKKELKRKEQTKEKNIPRSSAQFFTVLGREWQTFIPYANSSCWTALGSLVYLNIPSYTEDRLLMLLMHSFYS